MMILWSGSGLRKCLHRMLSQASTNMFTIRSHNCGQLREENIGETAKLCGWLAFKRMNRFLVLRDAYGTVQVRIPDNREDLKAIAGSANCESVLMVEGIVESRGSHSNQKMPTGAIELEILNHAPSVLPYSSRSCSVELGMKYRCLQLRKDDMQQTLRMRSAVTQAMRNYLSGTAGFIEVETPTLFRRTPGGAKEFIVPAPKPNNGKFYCLPQSPQQFKQLLMCAGLDRYYQIARCYRDETSKLDRQLEFTQVDFELSFTTQEEVMNLVEEIVVTSWPESLMDYRPVRPFKRMSYLEAYNNYGTDKPDLRIPWKILKFSGDSSALNINFSLHDSSKFFIARNCRKFINKENITEWKRITELNSLAVPFRIWKSEDNQYEYFRDYSEDRPLAKEDVVVFAWGNDDGVLWTLGQLIRLISNTCSLRSQEGFQFVWITEFPLFQYNSEEKKYESVHHPFTAPISAHEERVYNPEQWTSITAQHYDLVLNGVELGGGSIRIHNSNMQKYVVEKILQESTDELEHLIEALSYGAPPHGGFALGLDRYIALLAGKGDPNKPIRDVIAFPKTKDGRDLMCQSPTEVSAEVLKRYGIAVL